MSSQGPLPYLKVGGVEVANAARVYEYLLNGLGDTMQGHWELGGGALCSVLYRDDACNPITYVSPVVDPAPWYDANEPGSSKFLGVVLLGLTGYDSVNKRNINERLGGLGGGTFMQARRSFRTWKFTAALVSADDSGAEYGLRWLTSVLEASACDDCDTSSLEVRIVCPPADCSNDGLGRWVSYDVALVSGPTEKQQFASTGAVAQQILAGCRDFTIVEFELDAANPFLYKTAEPALDSTLVIASAVCNEMDAYPAGFYPGAVPFGGNLFVPEDAADAWAAQVAADAPRIWYRMDALAGVTEDDLGSLGQDGTYHNFPTLDQPGATPNSPAVLFQKTLNQYLDGGDSDAASIPTTGALSVEWWAKFDVAAAVGVAERMVAKFQSASREWLGERYASGEHAFRIWSFNTGVLYAHATFGHPTLGEFHHYVATITPSGTGTLTVRSYLDGVLVDTQTCAGDYPGAVAVDSPNVYWNLNELAGNFADSSGHGHTGTAHGGIVYGSPGAVRTGIYLGGTGWISAPDHADFDLGDVFTLEMWVASPAGAGLQSMIDKGTGAYQLVYDGATGNFRLQVSNGATIVTSTSPIPASGNWYHVVATKNGATVKLYLNGVDVSGVVVNSTLVNNANALAVGSVSGGGSNFFNAVIDEVALYPTALSAARVLAHFQSGLVRNGAAPLRVSGGADGFYANGVLDEVVIYDHALSATRIAAHYEATQPRVCVEVTPPTRNNQRVGAIFTFESTSGIGAVQMAAYSDCPRSGLETPELVLQLREVPANSVVVVDCSRHTVTVTVTDPATGNETVYDGQSLLLPTGGATIDPIQWIEVASCDDITCICVSPLDPCTYAGDTFVSIDTQLREG